jgi:hypothetical protein
MRLATSKRRVLTFAKTMSSPLSSRVLEVTPELRLFLDREKLRQRYWYEWIAELVIDRLWDELTQGTGGGDGN